ncbi:hypothetical protein [Chondromyces crocatus]|uniref:Uncharacterized protein n=1 Tax=Chondromyces crocatus TaxID=52 RepID=A0A0K1E726_CHOCO|nr:hypothetical protein [Chondromyces crocatus]AKT36665.1 uncharacterized protein CMC5_007850 [Chondromyces crocatus]
MFAGASFNEIGLVAFLVVLIMIAPKVSRLGEIIGGLFERSGPEASAGEERGGGTGGHDPEG